MANHTNDTETQSSGLPEGGKSRRVFLLLRDQIASGQLAVGSLLPSEQELSRIHGVSRVTIRRALEALASDGLIEKRTGSGSIVCAPQAAMSADMTTLIPQIVAMGRETVARLLSFSYGEAPQPVSRALKLNDRERVQRAVRVRLADGQPFSHLTTYVPEKIARNYSEADLANAPLFDLLERSGVRIASAHQTVNATLAGPDVAEILDVSVGSALLSLTRVIFDADGNGVEHLSALYRPDLFRLDMTMARAGSKSDRYWQPVIGGTEAGLAEEE